MSSNSNMPQNIKICEQNKNCGSTYSSLSQPQRRFEQKDVSNSYQFSQCHKPGHMLPVGNEIYDHTAVKQNEGCTEVVVKYIGTLAMPKDSRVWDHRTQSVNNAVKRLKESRVTHTTVKIRLSADGIRLFDAGGKLLMHHGHRGVVNFGLSPADQMLFCLVTHDDEDENCGPSCQIFCVDRELAIHEAHERTAELFGIRCEINIDDNSCAEFPSCAQYAVNLFRKFYVGAPTGSRYNTSSLDMAMFVPPGFESQFNVSGLIDSRDSAIQAETDKIVGSIMEKCQDNDAVSSQIHKWTNDTPYQKHLLKRKRVSDELDKTAVFPVESSCSGGALKYDLSLVERQDNSSLFSQNVAFNSLNVDINRNDFVLDREVKDSQNSVENLRKQSQKLLWLHPESRGSSLHVSKFCAYEKHGLDPESPMPALPLRTMSKANNHPEAFSHRTSTPIHRQTMALRNQNTESATIYDAPDTKSTLPEESQCLQSVALLSGCAANASLPNSVGSLISTNTSSMLAAAKDTSKEMTTEAVNVKISSLINGLSKETDRKLMLDIAEKLPRQNVSFHGSLETVFHGGEFHDLELGNRPPLGSCGKIAGPCAPDETGRAASWAVAFDKLLNDADGVAVFREHLKKEFSEENLNFWLKCEEYKHVPEDQRRDFAAEIYRTHVDPDAQESVNIDQDIKNAVKNSLHLASVDIYDAAQRHIYQLMKQDCYPRFKTSQLYRDAVLAEMEGRPFQLVTGEKGLPLNFMTMENDPNSKPDRTQEDRRKSLLFWYKKKPDAKSKNEDEADEKHRHGNGSTESEKSSDLRSTVNVRVTTPSGSVTQLRGHHGQKTADVLLKLGDKLNSGLTFVEALNPSTSMVLDVTKDVKTLSSKEILLVDCILFRLTLPNERSLAVRCRYKTTVSRCIAPILKKYGFDIDKVVMHITGEGVILKQKMFVDSLNCCHVMAESLSDSRERRKRSTPALRYSAEIHKRSLIHANSFSSSDSSSSKVQFQLEEAFRDVFCGNVDFSYVAFDELGVFNLEKVAAF